MPFRRKATNEQIIDAYKETGSVWRAAQRLGMGGQSVHERLQRLGYKLSGAAWTPEEEAVAAQMAQHGEPISRIAQQIGRPYAGVACKLSGMGISCSIRGQRKRRRDGFNKIRTKKLVKHLMAQGITISAFCLRNKIGKTTFSAAMQNHCPEAWQEYTRLHAVRPSVTCPGCGNSFHPLNARHKTCTNRCGSRARNDVKYFGGKRRNTVGLAEGVCQLCLTSRDKLQSHHVFGKENDPENEYLIALCSGCHQIVTWLGGRNFADTREGWENLINIVLLRRLGDRREEFGGIHAVVDIDYLTKEEIDEHDDSDGLPERTEITVRAIQEPA